MHVQNFHACINRSFAPKHEWICEGYGLYAHKCTVTVSLKLGCSLRKESFSESNLSGVIAICIIWRRVQIGCLLRVSDTHDGLIWPLVDKGN
jgi:hypothetical protein